MSSMRGARPPPPPPPQPARRQATAAASASVARRTSTDEVRGMSSSEKAGGARAVGVARTIARASPRWASAPRSLATRTSRRGGLAGDLDRRQERDGRLDRSRDEAVFLGLLEHPQRPLAIGGVGNRE